VTHARDQWQRHYAGGKGFLRLGDRERDLLAGRTPAPAGGGRALDLGCGTGELAVHLVSLGYAVDAVDFADSALARAREEHGGVEGVRWMCRDIERVGAAGLWDGGYDLVTMRLVYPFLHHKSRVLHMVGELLRPGGALVVITPVVERLPPDRRDIGLDDDEIDRLGEGWETVERHEAAQLAFLVLRGPAAAAPGR
jgi:protein-L-isoaspartate(D-aspartate) O-methyltransferase